ncbi:protein phosphatase CheZ [Paraburkholderia bonniea]|uniref:protein phosphatase CheZ n=1 Tax=Paraburkholderia bonniea TaxID=2152891 RepID=UPI0012919A03|nr:protein phosphatase CheZ [Paraburkholderia bonniea]WJF90413.1 protein phosphatase CheZ [Paraburkholderia bonniea]WJF93728.1 protein phosphatase CheZ [Paraburkholderia bonniea]
MDQPSESPAFESASIEPRLSDSGHATDRVLARIGQLTRTLRDSMRELGLDKHVELAAEAVPDARERLRYVASMTEQAAERVLNAIEIAQPIQNQLQQQASALDARWAQWYSAPLDHGQAGALLNDSREFLRSLPQATAATNTQLMEIMLAQDFQDLTGQVIKKIVEVVSLIEQQLLGVLVENIAPERREQFAANAAALAAGAGVASLDGSTGETGSTLLNGPQINPEGRADVVQDQEQVDDLLASLGF